MLETQQIALLQTLYCSTNQFSWSATQRCKVGCVFHHLIQTTVRKAHSNLIRPIEEVMDWNISFLAVIIWIWFFKTDCSLFSSSFSIFAASNLFRFETSCSTRDSRLDNLFFKSRKWPFGINLKLLSGIYIIKNKFKYLYINIKYSA